jgi:single-strand DNA-binding protein
MFNNVSLVGRLTEDPTTKESQLGKTYTSFCIAVDRRTKDKEADFFNCTLFGNSGVALNEYAQKGRMLAVSGKVQIDKYTNKDGVKMQAVKVIVDNWSLLDSRKEQDTQSNAIPNPRSAFILTILMIRLQMVRLTCCLLVQHCRLFA